jgi:hypothetical protein
LREWSKPRQLWALTFHAAGRLIARRSAVRVVMHPYENQPWEKELRLGLGTIEVVAWQHTPMSVNWFPAFPSRRDLAGPLLPDRLVTHGEHWRRLFAAHGYDPSSLDVRPPVRYEHLGELHAQPGAATVLVAGSIGWSETLELVSKAIDALAGTGRRIVVKLHPKMGGQQAAFVAALCAARGAPLPDELELASGGIAEALADAGVVLYNATSVGYEAIAAGIPAVFVRSDISFDADPVPAESTVVRRARTPEEIREAVSAPLDEAAAAALLRDVFALEESSWPA